MGLLGAGGMGEVYRARDPRLRREVAVKVIHAALATPEYVHRLNKEARSAGALNHPNILAVFDVGTQGDVPYIVSELLEGESLRRRLDRGPLPYRKALDLGAQVASALAAAHDKGIRHRDVKPANIFVTEDGRVKLLDFGLATVDKPRVTAAPEDSTASPPSRPGIARGTAGYMSPEQVRGDPADHRTDIFALGAVLYEMLTGARAFHRSTPVETMTAVLKEEPPDPLDVNPALPIPAAAVVRRCLEKSPEERFQSARDLAFYLHQLEQATGGIVRPTPPPRRARQAAALAAAAAVLGAAAWGAARLGRTPTAPAFQQITFDRGRIGGARITGAGIVYSQALGVGNPEVRMLLPGSPESRALDLPDADVLAERAGEVALSIRRRFLGGERFTGTLAVVPINGGTPREVLDEVEDADWDPSTGAFAVARSKGYGSPGWLEFPAGKVLYRSTGSLQSVRISRDGQRVAFLEDPSGVGSGGRIRVLRKDGTELMKTRDWERARGLAWSPRGDEVWFTAAEGRANRTLRAADMKGAVRVILTSPGSLTLWDAAPDGRALISRDDERMSVMGMGPGAAHERDLSVFDNAGLAAVSADGKRLLFGDRYGVYLRATDGGPPLKLGVKDVYPDDLSPDGTLVLATSARTDHLLVFPTGPGEAVTLPPHFIKAYVGARWFPDGNRILFNTWDRPASADAAAAATPRSYVTDRSGAPPQPLTPPGVYSLALSPDGLQMAVRGAGPAISIWPVAGGQGTPVAGSQPGDRPVAWSEDGRSIWVFQRGQVPALVARLDLATGKRVPWKTLVPPDPAGVYSINDVRITPRGDAYFYSYRRVLSELYLASAVE